MTSRIAIIGAAGLGLVLAWAGFGNLQKRDAGVKFHGNPFAIHQSGYGMILARLSQDTVNNVWHLGVEQVNPVGHVHGPECAHIPGHGEGDHEGDTHEEPGNGGHDTAGHEGHDHAAHDDHEGEEPEHIHGPHCEHEHGPIAAAPGHEAPETDAPEHIHGPDCEHDHGHHDHDHGQHEGALNPLAGAKDWLVGLKEARFERTNPYGINEAHRLAVSRHIEETLLRSYKMDPTNYGVYNAYYLFLTIHELRATPRAKDHARKVSNITIGAAFREDTNPAPWLTAANAVLNLFFLDQEKWREEGIEPPIEALEDYRRKMGYCLQQYAVLKQKAISEGRWETISGERRTELDEREQFSSQAFRQFDVMLTRQRGEEIPPKITEEGGSVPVAPVAETGADKGESR